MDAMTAVSLRIEGLQRMRAGFSLFGQAMVDAARGLYAMLTGAALLVAGALLTLWAWICLPFVSLFRQSASRKPFWRALHLPGLDFVMPVVRWGAWCLATVLLVVGIGALVDGMGPAVGEAVAAMASFVFSLTFFATLAVIVLAALLMIRLGSTLLTSLSRFLTRQGAYALAAFLFVMLAGAAGVVLYAVFQPSIIVIALISALALLAGLAGIALVSFGPSQFSMFTLSEQGITAAVSSRRASTRRSSSRTSRQTISPMMRLRAAIASRVQMFASRSIASPKGRAAAKLSAPSTLRIAGEGHRRFWSAMPQRLILVALLAVLALLLGWFGGSLLLRMLPASYDPLVSASKPTVSQLQPPAPAAAQGVGPHIIRLLVDGAPTDVSWRFGYRNLTARLDDGAMVRELALPDDACTAGAIVVFGSASSDGSAARNVALAMKRTRWLADWTRSQLVQCQGRVPAVVALSLGQARPEPPRPAQRGVRLMAMRQEDLAGLANTNDPATTLRDMAGAVFGDLADFERVEGCTLLPPGATVIVRGLPQACETADR
jgi:hypothetical protein